MPEVTLREITGDTVRTIIGLDVAANQKHLVAPNSVSIAQAHFEPKAWIKAIYADEDPVGFMMLFDDPDKPEYYLWRMMVAEKHQGHGYGRRSLDLLVDYIRTRPNATEITVSAVPGDGSPMPFYTAFGFVDTGEVHDGEALMRMKL